MNIWFWVVLWIACGVLDYGLLVAYYQQKFKLSIKRDRIFGLFAALMGPIGLLATISLGYYTEQWTWKL